MAAKFTQSRKSEMEHIVLVKSLNCCALSFDNFELCSCYCAEYNNNKLEALSFSEFIGVF